MLSELFCANFKVSLSTGAVILPVLLLLPVLRARYAAKWRYAIWMLLAVRLLLPLSPPLPQQPVRIPVPARAAVTAAARDGWMDAESQSSETVRYASPASSGEAATLKPAAALWLAGAAGFLLLQTALCAKLHRSLRHSRPASQRVALTLAGLASCAGGRGRLEPLVCSAVQAPVLCGFVHPRLYLPHERYSDEDLRLILCHELVHFRRRDLWCKLLLLAVASLHWFNPLVHILVSQAGKEMEFSCDEEVTKNMDRRHRAAYGAAILSALPKTPSGSSCLFTTGFSGGKTLLKRRLSNLFDPRCKRRGIPALISIAATALVVSGTIAYIPVSAAGGPAGAQTVSISIPQLTPDHPALIGRFALDGSNLVVHLDSGTGTGIGVGVSKKPDLTSPITEPWERYVGNSNGSSARASFVDLKGTYYVYAVSEAEDLRDVGVQARVTKAVSGADSVARQFERYSPYGVTYNAAQDTAVFGGERVSLFVVRRDGSFDLCWHDRSPAAGEVFLEGIQNAAGEATGIQTMSALEARELLTGIYGAYESSESGAGVEPVPYVYGGTQMGSDGFTATDLIRDAVPNEVQAWMDACDARGGGAYLWQHKTSSGYNSVIYYNLGGHYPWIVEQNGDALTVKLYDNNGRVAGDGFYLMAYQSHVDAADVTLLLDGRDIRFSVTED